MLYVNAAPIPPGLRGDVADTKQDEERNYKLPENEVVTIKQELIGLMISVPPNIQSQLGEAISLIADSDFWDRWDTLVDVSCQTSDGSLASSSVEQSIGSRLAIDSG